MISEEAIEAAAKAIGEVAHTRDFRVMAEAALRATGNVRDVSERVGKRYARLHQMLRDELQAQAWDAGYNAGWDDAREDWGKTPNPHLSQIDKDSLKLIDEME